jgi:ArsR family transcriptional regulator, arsenate/arsenite/antimonite-responsive transcriptional repressor
MCVDIASCIDICQYSRVSIAASLRQCCPSLLRGRLKPTEAEQLAAAFKVLADPARLRLLSLIAAQPVNGACVCNLTAPLALSQPTVSHHLKVMHEAGLLERERRGTWVFYRVRAEALDPLRAALSVPAAEDARPASGRTKPGR